MTDYHVFEGHIRPMSWGDKTYTVLPLPDDVAEALTALGAKRVEGEINDVAVNLAITKAPVIDGLFLYTGKTLLDQVDVRPGEPVDVRLRPVDPNQVDLPEDVQAALLRHGCLAVWDALTPGKRRGHLHQIATAKRADTRAKRIAKLMIDLTEHS